MRQNHLPFWLVAVVAILMSAPMVAFARPCDDCAGGEMGSPPPSTGPPAGESTDNGSVAPAAEQSEIQWLNDGPLPTDAVDRNADYSLIITPKVNVQAMYNAIYLWLQNHQDSPPQFWEKRPQAEADQNQLLAWINQPSTPTPADAGQKTVNCDDLQAQFSQAYVAWWNAIERNDAAAANRYGRQMAEIRKAMLDAGCPAPVAPPISSTPTAEPQPNSEAVCKQLADSYEALRLQLEAEYKTNGWSRLANQLSDKMADIAQQMIDLNCPQVAPRPGDAMGGFGGGH